MGVRPPGNSERIGMTHGCCPIWQLLDKGTEFYKTYRIQKQFTRYTTTFDR